MSAKHATRVAHHKICTLNYFCMFVYFCQARKSAAGTVRMKRALLMKAGQALSPEAFLLVLESESETKGTIYCYLCQKTKNVTHCFVRLNVKIAYISS